MLHILKEKPTHPPHFHLTIVNLYNPQTSESSFVCSAEGYSPHMAVKKLSC